MTDLIQHNTIQHNDTHEPRHISIAGPNDSGKVITPSSTQIGRSELRNLNIDEIDDAVYQEIWLTMGEVRSQGWYSVDQDVMIQNAFVFIARGDNNTRFRIMKGPSETDIYTVYLGPYGNTTDNVYVPFSYNSVLAAGDYYRFLLEGGAVGCLYLQLVKV